MSATDILTMGYTVDRTSSGEPCLVDPMTTKRGADLLVLRSGLMPPPKRYIPAGNEPEPRRSSATRQCPACLSDIPAEATTCRHCRKDLGFSGGRFSGEMVKLTVAVVIGVGLIWAWFVLT